MIDAIGYVAEGPDKGLKPFSFQRRSPGARDIEIEILYCGVCHTDLHQSRNDWGNALYPMVPGHEIVGRVASVGTDITRFRVGDIAGVGCMVDSCRHCGPCRSALEQYCEEIPTWTYNARERASEQLAFGGYSDRIVVDEHFAVKIPETLDLKAVAPLLCAGITTYSPLKHWRVGPGQTVGVIGLGGLGHMGLKFAKAMGAHVVMITTSVSKGADAIRLGADEVLVSSDAAAMALQQGRFDFLLNTVPVSHDANPYMELLKLDGTMAIVGALTPLAPLVGGHLISARRSIAGSSIGSPQETQDMLDFCALHGIVSDVEIIAIEAINEAFARLEKNDVRYRFVIDMASLKAAA